MHKMSILKQQFVILRGATDISWQDVVFMSEFLSYSVDTFLKTIWTIVAGVEQNRYKTNNRCIKHLPQTGTVTVYFQIAILLFCCSRNKLHVYITPPTPIPKSSRKFFSDLTYNFYTIDIIIKQDGGLLATLQLLQMFFQ